ncbi:MAG: 50S ribosomal protein L25/general stress protein Ctc [Pseudomonadota bacterium]
MSANIELAAEARPGVGKGAARQARRAGKVPGVVYGGSADPQPINLHQPTLLKLLKNGKFLSTLITLNIDGTTETVICRNVQRDVVKDLPTHADFLRLSQNSRINLMIPVEFVNEDDCPGLKKGGVLTVVRNEIELKVRASNIPEAIEADLTGLEVNDVIRISNVNLPDGARPTITDRDFMIANISAPSALASADSEDEEGDVVEEGAEVEATEEEGGEEE